LLHGLPVCTFAGSGSLGGHELIDLVAQIAQNEIFLRGHIAVIDVLRPLFERNLYPEFLVYRENDIEKIKAVYSQIVNRMAVTGDCVAIDLARIGNDIGDLVECAGHGFYLIVAGRRLSGDTKAATFDSRGL
jgi:hypothetical protein